MVRGAGAFWGEIGGVPDGTGVGRYRPLRLYKSLVNSHKLENYNRTVALLAPNCFVAFSEVLGEGQFRKQNRPSAEDFRDSKGRSCNTVCSPVLLKSAIISTANLGLPFPEGQCGYWPLQAH